MASIQWKDANSAHQFAGPIPPASQPAAYRGPRQNSRSQEIEELAHQSVRSQQVEDDLFWVVLNLPNQTSLTLYLGSNEVDAKLAAAMARGAVVHALEYAFGAPGSAEPGRTQ